MKRLKARLTVIGIGFSLAGVVIPSANATPIDEIVVVGRSCSGAHYCPANWRFNIYGGYAGGGSGSPDCANMGPSFPQLLWEPPDPGAIPTCTIESTPLPAGPPPMPGPGQVSVAANNNYEIDTDGDGIADVPLPGPIIIVGADANSNGIPDLWEGLVLNGYARIVP